MLGESFTTTAEHNRKPGFGLERSHRFAHPLRIERAVTVDHLNKFGDRHTLADHGQPGIARPRRCKTHRPVQIDDSHAKTARMILTAIGRSRININARTIDRQRRQTALQPLALVAADDHNRRRSSSVSHCRTPSLSKAQRQTVPCALLFVLFMFLLFYGACNDPNRFPAPSPALAVS